MTNPGLAGGWLAYALVVVVKVTAVLGVAGVVSWSLRGRTAALRHAVWVAATAGVVALAFLGAFVPAFRIAVPAPAWTYATSASATSLLPGVPGAAEPRTHAEAPASPVVLDEPPTVSGAGAPHTTRLRAVGLGSLLVSVWLIGVGVMLALTLLSLVHVRRFVQRAGLVRSERTIAAVHRIARELGVTARVRLLEGEVRAMPVTFGVLRPSLLLPSSASEWSDARLDAVLRHELAHIRRRDALTQLLAQAGCALYWFHPGMWLAAARLRVECEHACDDVVLTAGGRASAYAEELLQLARTMTTPPDFAHASFSMARPSRLRARLEAVLADRPRAARVSPRVLIPFAAAGLVVVCTIAMVTPTLALPTIAPLRTDVHGDAPGIVQAPASAHVADHVAAQPDGSVAPPTALAPQERDCWTHTMAGGGTVTTAHGDNTTFTFDANDGLRHRIVQRRLNGASLCMRTLGDIELDATGAMVSIPAGGLVVLASRGEGPELNLVITPEAQGLTHALTVNGVQRPFDADAREWRDAMLQYLHSYGEATRIRGEVASMRGQIASVRGRRASMMGEIASIRGQEARMRGEIAAARGRVASLRGQIASIQGRESAMRAQLQSADVQRRQEIERRIAEFDSARRVREIEEQIRRLEADDPVGSIEARLARYDTEARVGEVEARLAQLDVEAEVARIEGAIAALDADSRVAAIEQRIPDQERRLRAALARIR
jgi:beta-lactamase regulating signal transducer with metallopeptidase domain